MHYKVKNVLCLTALALILGAYTNQPLRAQGVVTLAESADQEEPALNQDIPNELSLFDESNSNMDELGLPTISNTDIPLQNSDTQAVSLPKAPLPVMSTPESLPSQQDTALQPSSADTSAINDDLGLASLLAEPSAGIGALGGNAMAVIDDAVFAKMSDLEKQTALLNLELRRERVKNEIEAIKNQRKQAIEQEQDKSEAKKQAKIEWEKAQEQKVLQEQQKLRELDIQFEKMRQEKLLNSYKNKMLEDNQKWIAKNADMYKQINTVNDERTQLATDSKNKLSTLKNAITSATNVAIEAKANYQREIGDLQTQISILKARIDAQEQEMTKQNPFAEDGLDGQATQMKASIEGSGGDSKLADMYAVMEIRGQGGELIAKLINQDGTPFYVKKGTTLQSGHVIDDITSTYVRADRNGMKDYLYFAAGGILPLEPVKADMGGNLKNGAPKTEEIIPQEFNSSDGVPGLGRDMMAR